MNFLCAGGFGRLFESVDFGGFAGIEIWFEFWLEFGLNLGKLWVEFLGFVGVWLILFQKKC